MIKYILDVSAQKYNHLWTQEFKHNDARGFHEMFIRINDEVQIWAKENNIKISIEGYVTPKVEYVGFRFETEKDAALFKLWWM